MGRIDKGLTGDSLLSLHSASALPGENVTQGLVPSRAGLGLMLQVRCTIEEEFQG